MHGSPVLRVIALAFVCVAVVLSGCGGSQGARIEIGYIGELSGRDAGLGVAGRDGAQMAVDDSNEDGGVEGRQVELVVRDDAQGDDAARNAVASLADRGVAGVVGPMTSAAAVAAAPVADERRLVMISPTTSTDDLNGKRDHFFRVYPDNRSAGREMARLIVEEFAAKRVAAVYDLGNEAHTRSWVSHLGSALKELGGSVESTWTFASGKDQDFYGLARRVAATRPQVVFIAANAVDTALLCQQLRAVAPEVRIATTEWSSTEDVISYGGVAVEGILFLNTFDRTDTTPRYVAFRKRFVERFGYEPGFASVHAYDATRILIEAVARSRGGVVTPDVLGGLGTYAGLQGPIKFDASGDVVTAYRPMTIRDGDFVPMR